MKYTDKQKENLLQIQDIEIQILKELDLICKKHNLHYSLSGGTLLGAVRHKDFIPWDDDIDIDVPYNDYLKLMEILPKELPNDLELIEYTDYNGYFCDFISRITYKKCHCVNTYTIDKENSIANDPRLNRIFIEIYPVCNTENGLKLKKQLFDIKKIYGYAMAHRFKKTDNSNYSYLQKLQTSVLSIIGTSIKMDNIFSKFKKAVNRFPNGDILFKPTVPIPVLEKNIFEKSYFSNYVDLEIRGNKFSAPKNYEKVLENLYGDWKKLPPEKDRKPSHFNLDKLEII